MAVDLDGFPYFDVEVIRQGTQNDCGVFLLKYLQHWDGDMPTQLTRDRVDLYKLEVVADVILHVSNAECQRILGQV